MVFFSAVIPMNTTLYSDFHLLQCVHQSDCVKCNMAWLCFLPYMQFQFVNTILEVINLLTMIVSCTGYLLETPKRMTTATIFSCHFGLLLVSVDYFSSTLGQ
jgi:hypothetical protein